VGPSVRCSIFACARRLDGLRYGLSMTLTPTVADWEVIRLPAALSFLYHAVRPFRLAAKYTFFGPSRNGDAQGPVTA
jgi:hypothetical protein